MLKLNDNNIYVGQIKQLLKSFNLPSFKVYDPNRTYGNGQHYLKDDKIYLISNNTETFVRNYKFGEYIRGLTTTLPISSNIYDSETHQYLGNYLRFLRDYINLDLMGMYNCCSYDSPRDFELTFKFGSNNSKEKQFSSSDSTYTLIMVPVKLGQKYTIALDYHGDIELVCAHYDANIILDNTNEFPLYNTYLSVGGTRFNHPFVYDKLTTYPSNEDLKEDTLKLFIKLPISCTSSIVVLEGDYTNNTNSNLLIDGFEQKLSNSTIIGGKDNFIWDDEEDCYVATIETIPNYYTKSELLAINLGTKALLSTRLLEYLSKQAIAPNFDVVDNVKRLQKTLTNKLDTYYAKIYGMWDDGIRESISKFIWENGIINKYYDMLAYFDKDVETKIGGLMSKYSDTDTFTSTSIGGIY